MCLLARIGDEAETHPVRRREVLRPTNSGRLFVQANDLELEDDGDSLQLTILGGRHSSDAAPPPELLPVQFAERDWKPLLAQSQAAGAQPEHVRDAAFEYCRKYAGSPQSFRAGQLLIHAPPLVNSIGMKLAPIPPGKFLMGSPDKEPGRDKNEGPQHEVILTRPLYLGAYDVTVAQFRAFTSEKSYKTEAENSGGAKRRFPDGQFRSDHQTNWQNPGFDQADDNPVVCVSWTDANAFCDWLSAKEGKSYALPTEAQWEYACRGGSGTRFFFGDDDQQLDQYAWYSANSDSKPHPVGLKKPNAWGLYDMTGNVNQWLDDWYHEEFNQESPKDDPLDPTKGRHRVTARRVLER